MERPINIVIVSLNDKFCKSAAQSIADSLDMFKADVKDLIVYDLINPQEVLEKCGIEYLKNRERGVVRNCSEYYDTVISINYDIFKPNIDFFQNSLVIYIKLPEGKQDKIPNKIDYKTRDEFLAENCNLLVELEQKSIKKCVEKTLQKLGEYYENC